MSFLGGLVKGLTGGLFDLVGSLFNPKMPQIIPPPPAPQVDQATIDREAADMARRRRGAAANILTGDTPPPAGSVAVKTLLGQ